MHRAAQGERAPASPEKRARRQPRWRRLRYRIRYGASKIIMPNSPSASTIPFVEYLKWLRFTMFTPPYPHSIDIQTQSGCNARCTFCGVGREQNKLTGAMSRELFEKVIDEALTFPRLRQINPYLLNEPLVDRRIEERIEYITRKRGSHRRPLVRIITNAGLLTKERAYRLLRCDLDEVNISFNSIVPAVYESAMRPLRYDTVMGNVLRLIAMRDRLRGRAPSISIWTVLTRPVEDNISNERAYWRKLKVGFKARKLDNRAMADIEAAALGARPMDVVQICPVPFWRAWVMFNGDMIMCCVDQERSKILGNCAERSLKEIWNDPSYQELRRRWRARQLDGLLCENCKGS
ncbi:MAG: radical SAM/SPASM domain-containing protein [Acidobacteriota bacterium]